DVAISPAGAPVTIDVLANDTDGDGNVNAATLSIVQQPQSGVAAVVGGKIVYSPLPGFIGGDSPLYTVQDKSNFISPPTPALIRVGAAVAISGYVYVDINGNAVRDSGEMGLAGVSVTLTKTDGAFTFTRTITTDATGLYQFSEDAHTILPQGVYTVDEIH